MGFNSGFKGLISTHMGLLHISVNKGGACGGQENFIQGSGREA